MNGGGQGGLCRLFWDIVYHWRKKSNVEYSYFWRFYSQHTELVRGGIMVMDFFIAVAGE